MSGLFSLGRAVQRPPPEFREGPTISGQTKELQFDDLNALNAWCHANGVGFGDKGGPGAYFQACYSIPADTVAVPTRKAWPSQAEIDQLREHEWAHARGWQHPGEARPALDMKALMAQAVRGAGSATGAVATPPPQGQ